jgi:hypothetical protein
MRNTRPADLKKMIQGLIILTLLCWATQTLVSQWAFGDEITGEKFVAPSRAGTLIELKSEATINGNEIRLNQIVRWPGAGDDVMEQTGDLIVGQFGAGKFSQAIDLDDVKTILGSIAVRSDPKRPGSRRDRCRRPNRSNYTTDCRIHLTITSRYLDCRSGRAVCSFGGFLAGSLFATG